jgi:LysR family cys regulon transcriptional activator
VDIGIATESLALYDELVTLPCYEWHHCVVVPPKHPLLLEKRLTLKKLAQYPIITYDFAFTGRNKINQAFSEAGIEPNIALTAIDADVIKTYVELGLGVGIVAQMASIPAPRALPSARTNICAASAIISSSCSHRISREMWYLKHSI